MNQITSEEALEMFKRNISPQYNLAITDVWDNNWPAYAANRLADCWYITFTRCLDGCPVGPAGLIALSKESGKIRYSAKVGE